MEHSRMLVETDTLGNGVMIRNTGMEYSDGQMEKYITDSGKRETLMGKDMTGGQMAVNIGENSRITRNGEKESNKRREYFTKTHMKKTVALAGVKYSEILQFFNRYLYHVQI